MVLDEHKHNFDIHINHIEHEDVCGDSLRIQQVFVNLMSNAIKYTPDGGNIIFSIEEKPNGFSELGCYEFTIEDNGIGMSRNSRKSCLILSAARMTTGQPEFREPVLEWQSAEILWTWWMVILKWTVPYTREPELR